MEAAICPQCGKGFYKDEPWKRVCLGCYISRKRKEEKVDTFKPTTKSVYIDKELLGKLVILCHPDKHNGSQMATEVTQKLLQMRR
jgi:hypothetical protein